MIDKLVQLLNLSNVKKIIYVDDIFCVERYLEDAHAVLRTWLETDDYHKLDFISSDKDVLEEEFDSWWNGATDDDKRNCVFDVMQLSDEGQNILLCLNNIKNHEIKVECMSPAEFTDAFIGDLKNEVKDSFQVLLLMDQELEDQKHGGETLLQKVEDTQYLHCGLFSGKFSIDEEIDVWKELGSSTMVYPLSKKRILDEPEEKMIEGLRNILWLNHVSNLKKDALEVFDNGYNQACMTFKNMDPASFDSAIVKTSKKEGCWEYVTLNRIFMVLLKNSIQMTIVGENNFKNLQNDLCKLRMSSVFCSDNEIDKSWLRELRNSELYTSGTYINQTYSPVANGDIFKIGSKKYILLFQPCSLAIRDDGKRSRQLASAYIIEIKNNKQSLNVNEVALENSDIPGFSYVNIASFKRVSLDVLDLVSFNTDGKAIIDVTKENCPIEDENLLQPNMLKRYHNISLFAKKLIPILIACDKGDAKNSIQHFCKSCFLTVPCLRDGKIIEFQVQRIERYNELLAQVLYSKLMNYRARIAVPNDFSE